MKFRKEQAESIVESLTAIKGNTIRIENSGKCYDGYSPLANKMVPDDYFWLFMHLPPNGVEATLISVEIEELSSRSDENRIICCVAIQRQCYLIGYEGISVPQYA
ncbi:hypothetical protein M3Y14_33980 (plasmid) [Bacillus thuringiensis]|uniref:hypothetical protein n=1 Tax=Bacillus thuringiensis TaxID=1428 RepID=UPI002224A2F3|nr:hypothetical protein [Bacillus thuringiensis]UYX56258.1 hypothetical protein M3Y14_33980 [Bacillus thuringiensis]